MVCFRANLTSPVFPVMDVLPSRDSLCIREQLWIQIREVVTSHFISLLTDIVIRCAGKERCACSSRNACPFLKWRFEDRRIPLPLSVYRSLIERIIHCLIGPLAAAVRTRNFIRRTDLHSIKCASSSRETCFFKLIWNNADISLLHKRFSQRSVETWGRAVLSDKNLLGKWIKISTEFFFFVFFVYFEKNKQIGTDAHKIYFEIGVK